MTLLLVVVTILVIDGMTLLVVVIVLVVDRTTLPVAVTVLVAGLKTPVLISNSDRDQKELKCIPTFLELVLITHLTAEAKKKFKAKDYNIIQKLEFCTPTAGAICVLELEQAHAELARQNGEMAERLAQMEKQMAEMLEFMRRYDVRCCERFCRVSLKFLEFLSRKSVTKSYQQTCFSEIILGDLSEINFLGNSPEINFLGNKVSS
ncbi:unnamed protein product [Lactuca virosa]|uniref:Uncharacterized protein n=1 Tax=Lactuca virosa TaxID=75947 RepID=A0AAU9NT63_9ASTR|nr:unnamed protein product [Lactuca virosa]